MPWTVPADNAEGAAPGTYVLNMIDTPGPRRLHLRGLAVAGGVRGGRAPGRRCAGHRGADAGEPLPRAGRRPAHHPGAQQDRPPVRTAREVRRGARRHHRLRPLRRTADVGEDRAGGRGAPQRDRPADPAPGRPRGPAGACADLRLRLRHLSGRRHLRPRRRRQAHPPRPDQDDVHRCRARDARGRRDQPRAGEGRRDRRRRGGLPDHRREGRPPVAGGRHGDQPAPRRHRGPGRLQAPQPDGLLRALPDRRRRLPDAARRARATPAQRRRAGLRAGDLGRPGLRVPVRLPRPAAHGDRPGAARARVQPRPHLDRPQRGLRGDHGGRHASTR